MDASRHLNPFLEDRKIKLEGLDVREQILRQGDFQTKADLDSGYWHVPLFEGHKKFVGCHFLHQDGKVSFWVWNVLFLGIKDAVWIFTKLLVPHKRYLRSKGIRMSIYIDDQSVLGSSYNDCLANTQIALDSLAKAGWVVNWSKSSEPPVQDMVFLGLVNCTKTMKYFVPEDKCEKICDLISSILRSKKVHIKTLAKLMGKLQFCIKAFGPCIRLLCRSSYHLISKASSWNSMITLSSLAIRELSFILTNWNDINGFPIRASLSETKVNIELCSDSSDVGTCVYQVCSESNEILLKQVFSAEDSKKSSTFRELLAFHYFYTGPKAYVFKDLNIVHYTDNLNCATILSVGSRNFSLQPLVLDIFLAWKSLNVKVSVIYLSRSDPRIEFADFHSRSFDLHDYSLDFDNFLFVSSIFGPFDVDCFASDSNKKCCTYFSKYPDEFSKGVNFFAQSLHVNVNYFAFPPVHLIIPAIMHFAKFKSVGCIIVPIWVSSHFWYFICEDGKHLNFWIKKFFIFSPEFISGQHVRNDMFKGVKKFNSLALKFDFSVNNCFQSQKSKKFCLSQDCFICS